jgi:hypothetical protein
MHTKPYDSIWFNYLCIEKLTCYKLHCMDKITQLENSLKSINQARFQTLVSHLLYLQGNKFLGGTRGSCWKRKKQAKVHQMLFL